MSAAATLRRRSKGSQMLCRMGTCGEIALMVGCSRALVGYWVAGERSPAPHWRRVLDQLYSIPVGAWDLPIPSGTSPVLSLRQQVLRVLASLPEARARVDAILRRGGIQ